LKQQIKSGLDLPESFEGWLWPEAKLFPRKELSMLIGHDGVGKTSIMLQLVAQWTREDEVVFCSMQEDGQEMTKAKLKAYNADMEMVVFQPDDVDGTPDIPWAIPDNLEEIELYLRATGASVAIFDSLDSHLSHSPFGHRARLDLAAVRGMAERLEIAIVFLHHFNKGGTRTSVDQAIGGARGVKAAMRNIVVWGEPWVGEDFEGSIENRATHAMAIHKANYGPKWPKRPSMIYAAHEVENPYWTGETLLEFELIDSTDKISPTDIYSSRHRKEESRKAEYATTSRDTAAEAILTMLATRNGDGEWMPAVELEERAIASGAGQRTVKGTRARLARKQWIENSKQGDGWFWRITDSGRTEYERLHAKREVEV
jgi:GTPase SAR1 family protein